MKEAKENLPIITATLLIIGATWMYAYYAYFGIDITNYLEFTEIFQLQFIFYILIAIPAAAGILYGHSFRGLVFTPSSYSSRRRFLRRYEFINNTKFSKYVNSLSRNINRYLLKINTSNKDKRPFYGKPILLIIIYTIIFAISMLTAFEIKIDSVNNLSLHDLLIGFGTLSLVLLLTTGFYYTIKLDNIEKSKRFIDYILLTLVIITFGMSGIAQKRIEAFNIINGKPEYEVSLLLKDKPLSSDTTIIYTSKDIVYVGQTKNYIFLYRRKNMQAHIIPRSQVIDMQSIKLEYTKDGQRKANKDTVNLKISNNK